MSEQIHIKVPPKLFNETQRVVKQISARLDGDFISYWISGNSRIVHEDAVAFYEVLRGRRKRRHLYLFIKSDGGNGQASLRIINLLRKYYKKITAFVPLECASAATMLVLGADVIEMGPLAYLSAVDTSITHDLSPINKDNDRASVSQNELSRVIKLWNENKQNNDTNPYSDIYKYIHPLVIGSVDRATSLSIQLTNDILSYHMTNPQRVKDISNTLNSGYPSHSYPITIREAQKIGLNVKELNDEVNDLLLELNELYSEMAQMAYTDFDELNYHDNEILKVIEGDDLKLFYQKDKDWHYRTEERRWIPLNDESSWRKIALIEGKQHEESFHIR